MNHHKRRKMKIYSILLAKQETPVQAEQPLVEQVIEEVKQEEQTVETVASVEEVKPVKKKKSSV